MKPTEENQLDVLVKGEWSTEKEAKKICDKLIKDMERYGTEPSLLSSVPAVLLMKPTERKGFDDMVISSVRDILHSRISAMTAVLEASDNTEKELETEASQRESAIEAARAAKSTASEQLSEAEVARAASEDARRTQHETVETLRGSAEHRRAAAEAAKSEAQRLQD